MIKRLFLSLFLLSLCALTPAQKAAILAANQTSDAACDRLRLRLCNTLLLDDTASTQTLTAANGLSGWASRTSAVTFSQATAANQFVRTRADNRENLITYSELPSDASWNKTTWPSTVDGNTITATASSATHGVRPATPKLIAGTIYKAVFRLRYNNYQYAIVGQGGDTPNGWVVVDLQNGQLGSQTNLIGIIEQVSAGVYDVTLTFTRGVTGAAFLGVAFATASDNAIPPIWTPVGTEKIDVLRVSLRSTLADPTYQATTTYPMYRGLNGRSVMRANGAQYMTSTALASDILAAGAKTFVVVVRPALLNSRQHILANNSGTYPLARIANTGSTFQWVDNDGGGKYVDTPASANIPQIVSFRLNGTKGYAATNGSAETSADIGSSAALNQALEIGAYGAAQEALYGDIASICASNTVWSAADVVKLNRCEARKWGADLQ